MPGLHLSDASLDNYAFQPILLDVPTIVSGDFEWDDAKAISNATKHGVTFEEAALALAFDPHEVAYQDPSEAGQTHSLVMSPRVRVLLVVTTERGSRTRIVTARKANTHEERIYQAGP